MSTIRTARLTGLWYFLMAVFGILGFLIVHPRVFVASDAYATLVNLQASPGTARIRLVLEVAIVVSQALTAVYFYKLFRPINGTAGLSIALWGTVNAVAVLISALAMAAALSIAHSTLPQESQLVAVALLSAVVQHAWGLGALFFGLWLIPLGYVIITARIMPLWLGRVLVIGGVGYLFTVFLRQAGVQSPYLELLTVPATIGELWAVGYLLLFGIRTHENEQG
jgi:hypothetical protein